MVDADHGHFVAVLVDAVEHSVRAASGAPTPLNSCRGSRPTRRGCSMSGPVMKSITAVATASGQLHDYDEFVIIVRCFGCGWPADGLRGMEPLPQVDHKSWARTSLARPCFHSRRRDGSRKEASPSSTTASSPCGS